MIFNREKRIWAKINALARTIPTYGDGKVYSYNLEKYDGIMYLKVFYEGELTQTDIDKLYVWGVDRFTKFGYDFHGLVCYNDNHEICLDFIKD